MNRRAMLTSGFAAAAALGMGTLRINASTEEFEIMRSEAEWRKRLSAKAYNVLREEGTERAFTSPLNDEHRKGVFACAGCDLPLYSSETKYESGTGWPSFWKPLPNAIGTKEDNTLFSRRTEVHCRRCGGHLGHVFDDGPKPTGKRYCMNGVALKFVAA
ncbi:peptide-methionine (R)-S-oxide reductase MsrB [Profundibacter amoris]|uniref:peptide-methionine (R)-S-oxide reductase n=1 Tax=Profundibacter amoris TaxID=2171755 RepID=A0A347UF22_9RHOB|nr:peptide-methionine (R)-S-oxide reductase MsrB [Profundibacter amoris]AXX97450.1 peptide-methionine (R)-S-oxide reductase [Profundibacter amoris]